MLRRLEETLRAALEAPFARLFPQTVQPLEMAATLRQALEASKLHGPQGTYVHNQYELRLSLEDHRKLAVAITSLERELGTYLRGFAAGEGLHCGPEVTVLVVPEPELAKDDMQVASGYLPRPEAALVGLAGPGAKGAEWAVGERTVLGRSADCEVRLEDPQVSRHHAAVTWHLVQYEIDDLGSQNGTYVNAAPVSRAALSHDDLIELGLTQLRLELRPARG